MPDLGDREVREVLREQRAAIDETRMKVSEVSHKLANEAQKNEYQFKLLDQSGADRHEKLADSFAELKKFLTWAGGLIFSIMLSFMGWAVLQQYSSNESQKRDLQTQLNLLKEQDRSRAQYREEVLSRLPPGGSEATLTTEGGR